MARGQRNVPGPGSYDVGANTMDSARSFNRSHRAGAGSFNSSEQRFAATSRANKLSSPCAPGQYSVDENAGVHAGAKEPLAHRASRSNNKNGSQGRAGFNSTAPRPATMPGQGNATGGPGSYDVGHLYTTGGESTSVAVSSSFKSAAPAHTHVRKSATPGVGTYDASQADTRYRAVPSVTSSFKGPAREIRIGATPTTGTLPPAAPVKTRHRHADLSSARAAPPPTRLSTRTH